MAAKRSTAGNGPAKAKSRKGPEGRWSGPKPTREAVKARGGAYREVYLSPEMAARLERLRALPALGLPAERWLGALFKRAVAALERENGLPTPADEETE